MSSELPDPVDPLFASIVRAPSLHDVVADLAESGLEIVAKSKVIDHLPIVGLVRALYATGHGFREAHLVKKLAALLDGIGEADDEEVEEWRARVHSDKGAAETGERVLAIVDAAASVTKAQLVGWVLRHYLDGYCDSTTLRRTVEMIANAITEDLIALVAAREALPVDGPQQVVRMDPAEVTRLAAAGLLLSVPSSIRAPHDQTVIASEGMLLSRPAGSRRLQ